jgi:circadian clock protein KaiC
MHLAIIHKIVLGFQPRVVVLDPVGSLIQAGNQRDAHSMMIRLIDFLKQRGITAFLTNLTSGGEALERTDVEISSIVDTWLFTRDIELDGERNRALYVLKSRGMAHSNQLREFLLSPLGVDLLDVYVGPDGVLTGSSRLSQEAREKSAALARRQDAERRDRDRKRKREALEARIAALRKEFEVEEAEVETAGEEDASREEMIADNREAMSRSRRADLVKDGVDGKRKRRKGAR